MNKKTMGKAVLAAVAVVLLASAKPAADILTKSGKTTVVNTTTLATKVRGFRGPTPVKIYIKKNKIQKVEALANRESPQYFNKAKGLLKKYEGMSVKKAMAADVDGVTGATFSSNALKKNVQAGLKYYQEH